MTDPGVQWSRVSRGILVLGLGLFLLLTTTGYLPWGFWLEAVSFWPVLLIGLGIRIMFRKSRAPWAILLSPVLILWTMAYVANAGVIARTYEWAPISVVRAPRLESWQLSGDLAFDDFSVNGASLDEALLLTGRTASGQRGRPRMRVRDDWAHVTLGKNRFRNITFHFFPTKLSGWDVEISDALPMKLDLDSAFSDIDLDLSAVQLERLDIEGAFNSLEIDLGDPASNTRLMLDGAFNSLDIRVPWETPISIVTDGFINLVDRRHDPPPKGAPGYKLYVDGAFNSVSISSY